MSLNYDLTKMKDREVHFPPEAGNQLNGVVQSLVWVSIPIGINEITEKNVNEFWLRTSIWQTMVGAQFTRSREANDGSIAADPILITKEDVRHAVGLRTNVSHKTRPQFFKGLWDTLSRYEVD